MTLYEHARRLLADHPDGPLPRQGRPLPDEDAYRRRWHWLGHAHRDADAKALAQRARAEGGPRVARAVGAFLSGADSPAARAGLYEELVAAYVPPWHELPTALAPVVCDVASDRLRELGRWLVRDSADHNPVKVGLALLEGTAAPDDVELVKTLAVIGDSFSPAAVRVVKRLPDSEQILLWIAGRTSGWGRVYPVEALCESSDPLIRRWLLRHAVVLDPLSGYYAGRIAMVCDLRAALDATEVDDDLLDGAGRILMTMTYCAGMGRDLWTYRDSAPALMRYITMAERATPTAWRFHHTAVLSEALHKASAEELAWRPGELRRTRERFAALVRSPHWIEALRDALADPEGELAWLIERYRAFPG